MSNNFSRRYFYPLISTFEPYNKLESSSDSNLIVATQAANEVLCLPIYVELGDEEVRIICKTIHNLGDEN